MHGEQMRFLKRTIAETQTKATITTDISRRNDKPDQIAQYWQQPPRDD